MFSLWTESNRVTIVTKTSSSTGIVCKKIGETNCIITQIQGGLTHGTQRLASLHFSTLAPRVFCGLALCKSDPSHVLACPDLAGKKTVSDQQSYKTLKNTKQ